MRAGKLRHRITVEEPSVTQDASGDPVVMGWVTRTVVWGDIGQLRSRESLMATQLLISADAVVTLRWAPQIADMDERWRLRCANLIYDILSVVNVDKRNRQYTLLCRSGLNKG